MAVEREWDQDKLACMILCGSFHTITSAVPVFFGIRLGPGPSSFPGPVEVLAD